MRVEKIELIGFKSFSEKTVFNLHPGITCIVGPNGCGKSNIVDSFKWVLGEQSAKSLRGDKMEEVIFSGTEAKKPRGMAEVTMHVSGLGEPSNGGANVTAVTRRLYRSGDSDYLLNRQSCRLRDIKDVFLDTGLELKSYSIFEQDRIAGILNSKPEERRFLIEEVAGVVKYKVRRQEAHSKLESSKVNLERINDIAAEVKRQINALDRQVKKAERYKRLMAELREVELRIAKKDYDSLGASLTKIEADCSSLREEEALLRAGLTKTENDLEVIRLSLAEKEKALNEVFVVFQEAEREIAEKERKSAVLMTETEGLTVYLPRLEARIEELKDKARTSEDRKREIRSTSEALSAELDSMKEALGEKSGGLRTEEEGISGLESRIEENAKEAFRASETISRLRNELHTINTSIENLRKKSEAAEREKAETRSALKEAEGAVAETSASITANEEEARRLSEEKTALATKTEELKRKIEELRTSLSSERERLASETSRLEALGEMTTAEAAGAVPESLRSLGFLADVIEVPREYEKAVEGALGGLVRGIIVNGADEAITGLQAIKDKEVGRTAFIPLELEGGRIAGGPPEGVIGRASDLVTAKEGFGPMVKTLLEGVLLVESIEKAASLKERLGFVLVSLEGEILDPSGVFTGGGGGGVLMKKRQMRETAEGIEKTREKIGEIEGTAGTTSALLEENKEAVREAEEKAAEIERRVSLLGQRTEMHRAEAERAERKLSYLDVETRQDALETESLQTRAVEKEDEIRLADEKRTASEEETAGLKERLSVKKSLYEERKAETFDLRLSINSLKERLESLDSETASTTALLSEISEKMALLEDELEKTKLEIMEKHKEKGALDESIGLLVVRADERKTDISARREAISLLTEEAAGLEQTIKSLRGKIEPVARGISELDVRRAEHRLMIENLSQTVRLNHDIEISEAAPGPYEPQDDERLALTRKKIADLGPVSLGTIEEYEDLRQRHDFLAAQKDDLEKSIAELEEAISRINTTTRKKLREAFEALRAKFSEVFVDLFGGGRAELVLTDETNILETGMDIVAQPPGKKLQNINLLSGGEKTLTALALLFSSFLIKPTPMCILDEADAALDEANTEKFSLMLKALSKEIQFIVVTHNKVTMEAADYIYGITMEEKGVSKVISIELEAA